MKLKYYLSLLNCLIIMLFTFSCTDEGNLLSELDDSDAILGCTNDLYDEYSSEATEDDGSCFNKSSITYDDHIKTVFDGNCIECHSSVGDLQYKGLSLYNYEDIMEGSNNGPVIDEYDYNSSVLWTKISSGSMPLGYGPLVSEIQLLIKRWIDRGAY